MRRTVPSLLAALAALMLSASLLSSCGGSDASAEPPVTVAAPTTTTTTVPKKPVDPGSFVAVAKGALPIYSDTAAEPVSILPAQTQFETPMSMLVYGHDDDKLWLDVGLQSRPNGSRAWVRRADVTVQRIHTAIDVNLTTRMLQLRDGDTLVLETPVVIGTETNPTPQGIAYVTDVIPTGNPGGAYGPFAFALSSHSETLTEFAGGDGQVAIHGTNAPYLMGQAASHGCVRVPNLTAIALSTQVPVGTPVVVHT